MKSQILPLWSGEMKIRKICVLAVGLALFVLLSVGILPARNVARPVATVCPYINYPCMSLPQGFKGWPSIP